MTDDELDRALLALPLAEPPPELRPRILAATVLAQPPAIRLWELWLVGTLLGLGAWLCVDLVHAGPRALAAGLAAVGGSGGIASPATLLWLAVGISAVWWISNPTLMLAPRVAVTKRS